MSIKKILILGIILSLLTIGAVSAYETTDQLVKIANDNGFTYHNNVTDLNDDFAQNFTKGSTYVMICYNDNEILSMAGFTHFENKTINNTKGIYAEMDGDYYFHFQHGDGVVYTRSNDESMIEKLAIGNSAGNSTANATATDNSTANATDNATADSTPITDKIEKILADNGYTDKQVDKDMNYDYAYEFKNGSSYVAISFNKDEKLSKDNFMDGFVDKTINNTKGIYNNNSGVYLFHYQHGKDIVYIRTNNESMIEKVALGN